jgi:DNA repair protein RadC
MKRPINQWSKDDRPREKLLEKGVETLSNAELIAILIGSGNTEQSAVDLSQNILNDAGNHLHQLAQLSLQQLMQYKGIGEAKAISIVAALEIGRRRNLSKALQRKEVKSSEDAFNLLSPNLSDKTREEFWLIIMKKNTVVSVERLHEGGLDTSMVDIRLLLKRLLEKDATNFIMAHNHPSGKLSPSQSDINLTKKIKEAVNYLDIKLLDHLIIGGYKYYSFADEQYL